jgi:hypothetical protein
MEVHPQSFGSEYQFYFGTTHSLISDYKWTCGSIRLWLFIYFWPESLTDIRWKSLHISSKEIPTFERINFYEMEISL